MLLTNNTILLFALVLVALSGFPQANGKSSDAVHKTNVIGIEDLFHIEDIDPFLVDGILDDDFDRILMMDEGNSTDSHDESIHSMGMDKDSGAFGVSLMGSAAIAGVLVAAAAL